jgi:hypothetical protein
MASTADRIIRFRFSFFWSSLIFMEHPLKESLLIHSKFCRINM